MTRPRSAPQPLDPARQHRWYLAACASFIALLVFMTAREAFIAPLHPGGSALVLKGLPLAFASFGLLKRRLYTYQWAALLVLAYIALASVGAMSDPTPNSRIASAVELALGIVFFVAAIGYVHPYKRAARAAAATCRSPSDSSS